MKKVFKKNYLLLFILILGTIFLTLFLSNLYVSKNKTTSKFYEYSNKINPKEFSQYIIENQDAIIYISDKYDLNYEKFENDFQNKIDSLNLKEKVIYIEKSKIKKSFISDFEKEYKTNLIINKSPLIIIIIDNKIIKTITISNKIDVDTFIDYGEFE